jgi:hypothetical protein
MGGVRQGGGVGLFGNLPIVQEINRRGGLLANDPGTSQFSTSSSPAAGMPGWAIAGITVLSLVLIATVVVVIQLVVLIRSSS